MVAEMVPQKELQPRAFSIMPLVWSLGSVVGPAFGGFFAQPAEQYPGLFGDNTFLKKFPYALPNLMAAIFFIISTASATLFLKASRNNLALCIIVSLLTHDRKRWRENVNAKTGAFW